MKKVSIVIPTFNEASTLVDIIRRVQAVDISPLEKEIIVVDNNSTDDTQALANALDDVLVLKEAQQGKGAAVRTGFKAATGDIVLIQDADLEYDPGDYPALLAPILAGETEMVLGIRHYVGAKPKRGLLYNLGNRTITVTTNLLYGAHAAEYTGGYKVFTKRVVEPIRVRCNDFAYEHELVCKVFKKGFGAVDVPIRYSPRDYAGGKKINWRDGFRILWAIIKYRFTD